MDAVHGKRMNQDVFTLHYVVRVFGSQCCRCFLFFLWRGGEWDADIRFTFLVHAYIIGKNSRQQLHCSLQVDSASTLE